MKKTGNSGHRTRIGYRVESQDDVGYLTGRHSSQDDEKQIKTPEPRKSGERSNKRRTSESEKALTS